MRVGILSDIHGNLIALQAVLSNLRGRKVEKIICLGDVAATGPQPCEVIELLQKLKWPCVMGNTDEQLAKNIPEEFDEGQMTEDDKRKMRELDDWTRKQLTKSHRNYLSTFKPTIKFAAKNSPSFVFYHGSPRSNHERIEATTPDDELTKYLEGHDADIFAGGHAHAQMFRRFRRSIIVNPGSVGLPFEIDSSGRTRSPARAEYAIVRFVRRSVSVEFLSIPYSLADLKGAVRDSGLPNSHWWLSDWQ